MPLERDCREIVLYLWFFNGDELCHLNEIAGRLCFICGFSMGMNCAT